MAEIHNGKVIKLSKKDEERVLLGYTNRRRMEKRTTDSAKSNEDRKLENDQEFVNVCSKIEECCISKTTITQNLVRRSRSASTTSSHSSSSTTTCHISKDVEEFQNFLENHGGHYGGWKVKDHLLFVKTRNKLPLSKTADVVHENFPDITVEEVEAHDKWYREYLRLRAANKRAVEEWKRTRKPTTRVKSEHQTEPLPQKAAVKRDPNIKEKLEIWKAHTLATKLERLEENRREELRKKREEEERRKAQEEKIALVNQYREEKCSYEMAMRTAKETEELQARQEAMRSSALLLKYFRYEDRRFTDRQRAKKRQQQEGKGEIKRKSCVEAKRDPNRLLQPTLGWIYHTKKAEDTESTTLVQGPLYVQHLPKLGKPGWRKLVTT